MLWFYRRMLQKAHRKSTMDINCMDSLGRGAISISIDSENLEMLELLLVMQVSPRDALLQAIDVEFVEAAELLLEYEELTHKDGDPYVSNSRTVRMLVNSTTILRACYANSWCR